MMDDSFQEFNVTALQIQEKIKWEECQKEGGNETVPDGWCPRSHDKILCWSPAPPGIVLQFCFAELHGVMYDTTQNATRVCSEEGIWANYTNYSLCREIILEPFDHELIMYHIEVTATVYLVGFAISLVALCLAVAVFLFYKDLRCLRNTIHTNLFCSHILVAVFWILNYALQMKADMASCTAIIILLHYFQLTNFFWMFVEGLYLYMLVVETFVRENMKLMGYMFIGWGLPAVIILIWSIAQIFIRDPPSSVERDDLSDMNKGIIYYDPINIEDSVENNCSWYNWSSTSGWIFQGPALVVLAINFLFLIRIMIVLITKLRSSTNVETQMNRKATKALLVLIPLLGITYVIMIWGPDQSDSATLYSRYMYYNIIRNALLSTQGFMVALLYCFLNNEVRNAVRHHYQRWADSRQIGRRSTVKKSGSIKTEQETLRLYKKCDYGNGSERMNRNHKKRESTTSDITTMTTVHSSRVSNGSVSGRNQPDV